MVVRKADYRFRINTRITTTIRAAPTAAIVRIIGSSGVPVRPPVSVGVVVFVVSVVVVSVVDVSVVDVVVVVVAVVVVVVVVIGSSVTLRGIPR